MFTGEMSRRQKVDYLATTGRKLHNFQAPARKTAPQRNRPMAQVHFFREGRPPPG